ncbi:hypothetical protein [Streptomyces sp. PR69]|uniref:hypothetical protein n=1 Tax=Streptomyces sp. PR69 TaxID=2984950 RepID=UPI00226513CD|nr:hypothetical protein [Streptomyces sp. PR69]
MAITDDLRKTFTDPKPLYFAAGTADLAYQQALKLPELVEQIRAEAPARIEAVRKTDPRAVQEKMAAQAKETSATVQAKVAEVFENLDTDFRKFGETAQDLALRGVGFAVESAVKVRDTYEKVAEHGEQAVRTWRGEAAEEITEIAVAVEPQEDRQQDKTADKQAEKAADAGTAGEEKKAAPARKAPAARKTAAKKATPPAR